MCILMNEKLPTTCTAFNDDDDDDALCSLAPPPQINLPASLSA